MKYIYLTTVALSVAFAPLASVSQTSQETGVHTWTDNSGKYKTDAEFVDFKDGIVRLRRADGNIVPIPFERLSEKDRQFVTSLMEPRGETVSEEVEGNQGYVDIVHDGKRYSIPGERWADIVSKFGSEEAQAKKNTGSAATTPPLAHPVDEEPSSMSWGMVSSWLMVGALAIALIGFGVWQYVIEPRRRRRPLLEAADIINGNQQEQFEKAEKLLSTALTAGLRGQDIVDARFALAYVRGRLAKYADAEAVLADLKLTDEITPETFYLEMWTATQRKDFDKVEEIFQKQKEQLEDLPQTRLMASIAFVKRAQRHWERKEVSSATHYFQQIRELGELVDAIPTHIEDHQILLGVQELFQKNFDAAREHFHSASDSSKPGTAIYLKGELGKTLCLWLAHPQTREDVDIPLGDLADQLAQLCDSQNGDLATWICPKCQESHTVRAADKGLRVFCTRCLRLGEVQEVVPIEAKQSDAAANETERQLLETSELSGGDEPLVAEGDAIAVKETPADMEYSEDSEDKSELSGGDEPLVAEADAIAVKETPADMEDAEDAEAKSELSGGDEPLVAEGDDVAVEETLADMEGAEDAEAKSQEDEKLAEEKAPIKPLLSENDLLVRDVRIWHLISKLHVWLAFPENEKPSKEELESLKQRANRVIDIDAKSGHAPLIEGLIFYYFGFEDEDQRKAAYEKLVMAVEECGVTLPEVHSLIDGEQRWAERRAKAARQLIKYIRAYLTDGQVPEDVRRKVKGAMSAYAKRFEEEIGSVDITPLEVDNAPTARDMGTRLEGLEKRLEQFIRSSDVTPEDLDQIEATKDTLDEAGTALQQQAREFEEAEGEVLSVVGQILLKEEEQEIDE